MVNILQRVETVDDVDCSGTLIRGAQRWVDPVLCIRIHQLKATKMANS